MQLFWKIRVLKTPQVLADTTLFILPSLCNDELLKTSCLKYLLKW